MGLVRGPVKTYLFGFLLVLDRPAAGSPLQFTLECRDHGVYNRALLRNIYRACPSAFKDSGTVMEWIGLQWENLTSLVEQTWNDCWENTVVSGDVAAHVHKTLTRINAKLPKLIWAHPDTACFMRDQATVDLETYDPVRKSGFYRMDAERIPHFSWRWLETTDQEGPDQLGPFFTSDLARLIQTLENKGTLSPPLLRYLSGRNSHLALGEALHGRERFGVFARPTSLTSGRWPSHPSHGLTLMQAVALQAARDSSSEDPILAVNGPPGTGKTTLIKDLIADVFVARTRALLQLDFSPDWFNYSKNKPPREIEFVLDHSLVVASSNNKAVENISRELPGLAGIALEFRESINYFAGAAKPEEWGVFCAVLGNKSNRWTFTSKSLDGLRNHLQNLADPHGIGHFKNKLNQNPTSDVSQFVQRWLQSGVEEVITLFRQSGCEDLDALAEVLATADDDARDGRIKAWGEDWARGDTEPAIKALNTITRNLFKASRVKRERRFLEARKRFLDLYEEIEACKRRFSDLVGSMEQRERLQRRIAVTGRTHGAVGMGPGLPAAKRRG